MDQPLFKLPFKRRGICTQANSSPEKRSHKSKYENTGHALDFTKNKKTPFEILASADGKATTWKCCHHNTGSCRCGLGFGNQVRIYHKNYFTFYAHLSKIVIKNGKQVRQGEVIGIAGKTGRAGNIHIHWTLGKESKKSKIIEKKFIPFCSINTEKIEIRENHKKKWAKSTYFKEACQYTSSNKP